VATGAEPAATVADSGVGDAAESITTPTSSIITITKKKHRSILPLSVLLPSATGTTMTMTRIVWVCPHHPLAGRNILRILSGPLIIIIIIINKGSVRGR